MPPSQKTKSTPLQIPTAGSHHVPYFFEDQTFSRRFLKDSAQKMIIPAMIVAQFSCIFPIGGKLQSDVKLLRFNIWSANSIISLLITSSAFGLGMIPFIEFWGEHHLSYDMARRVVYGVTSTLYMAAFFRLAGRWKNVMQNWEAVEGRLANFKPVNATTKIIVCTFVFMSFSLFEHMLSYRVEGTINIREYFLWSFRQLFMRTEFAMWKGYLASLVNCFMMLAWNFTDLFLGVVSMALCSAFDQFNLELESSVKSKGKSLAYWRNMRETYNLLALFTRFLNKTLALFITVSFINNLIFICLQLLGSLKLMGLVNTVYFSVSFGLLIFRTCFVCLTAAGIYESSKKPIKLLFSIPSGNYNSEIHRLLLEVIFDHISFSGYNFFYITKSFLLKVAGTILTCEICLVQLEAMKLAVNDPYDFEDEFLEFPNKTNGNCTGC